MENKGKLIIWDLALLIGIVLYINFRNNVQHYGLIIGLATVQILINCVRNHIAAYNLSGKLYKNA